MSLTKPVSSDRIASYNDLFLVILIPHTFNFLLWVVWIIMMKKDPENYLEDDGQHRKFGHVRKDGTIAVPNRLTLKWIPNYYWRLNEPKSVMVCYIFSILFCILGLIIYT